ncbi:Maf1-domain-containing protein [Lentinus tigrinus ALCF2SS1-7]|uniref:Repressor of RNA polymerase III transcription MAF1 n=1 Tax=Lentinus tigrinus ALCF2SS1-6 TaxID=1328759 RepID=A0A5C2SB40_9APHY|nr:Maf1-domain-containing protein [Lentinus tigrinus ALCF2SS1-6]RPD75130.1 Maf1-domain-containing protein [Lentinus tigrinus ALCF2SS1-7]
MKYIEIPDLSRLAQALTHEGPECSVHTRIEAYSCKNTNRDKKLFRNLENAYVDEVSHSPPLPSDMALDRESEMTPFGPMQESQSRKTLYLLIATLNVAFPDHEFSDVRPYHFNREESGASVLNALSTTLVSPRPAGLQAPRTYSSYPPASSDFFPKSVPTSSSPLEFYVKPSPRAPSRAISGTHPSLYQCLNKHIDLADCEVYSYTPDIEFDPHANDYSDEEDDIASVGDEQSSDDDTQFQFDDYDVDEQPRRRSTGSSDDSDEPPYGRPRRRGALLWSSHWFFLNRKMKRILFISIWARSKGVGLVPWMEREVAYGSPGKVSNERFLGWEGAVGAGARAMGLSVSANA